MSQMKIPISTSNDSATSLIECLTVAAQEDEASFFFSTTEGEVLLACPDLDERLVKALLEIPSDRQRSCMFRLVSQFLSEDLSSPAAEVKVAAIRSQVITRLKNTPTGPQTSASVAFDALRMPDHAFWASHRLLDMSAQSPDMAANIWIWKTQWWRNDRTPRSLFHMVVEMGALVRLLASEVDFISTTHPDPPIRSLAEYVLKHIALLPLGHAPDAIWLANIDPAIHVTLFERALSDPDTAPLLKPTRATKPYPHVVQVNRERALDLDVEITLDRWAQNACKSLDSTEMPAMLDAMERALPEYPFAVAQVLFGRIFQEQTQPFSDESWQAVERLILAMPSKYMDRLVPKICQAWPQERWAPFVQDCVLGWLSSRAGRPGNNLETILTADDGAVSRGFRMTSPKRLSQWLGSMRPSVTRNTYVETILRQLGPAISVNDSTRLYLTQSPDGQLRQMAITLPYLEKMPTVVSGGNSVLPEKRTIREKRNHV